MIGRQGRYDRREGAVIGEVIGGRGDVIGGR